MYATPYLAGDVQGAAGYQELILHWNTANSKAPIGYGAKIQSLPCGSIGVGTAESASLAIKQEAPRNGAELHKPKRSGGAEASDLERGARAGISPTNSKPLVLAS
jgi:hypothetical protein